MIEILVVIVILSILAAIAVTVGGRVLSGGKARATEDVIRVLDQGITSLQADKGGALTRVWARPSSVANTLPDYFPIVDGRSALNRPGGVTMLDMTLDPPQPSLSLFIAAEPDFESRIAGIDSKLLERTTSAAASAKPPTPAWYWSQGTNTKAVEARMDGLLVIKDGWGRPIRMVLPEFGGGYGKYSDGSGGASGVSQVVNRANLNVKNVPDPIGNPGLTQTMEFSRSYRPIGRLTPGIIGDGDEGLCAGGAPYYYSSGGDGDPGTRDDNVYTYRPQYAPETAKLK